MSINRQFLAEFKHKTEAIWQRAQINPIIYGFQFQPSTRWNPGLTQEEIVAYERALGVRFPDDFRAMLQVMNGTDKETINVYGSSGEPYRTSVGVYAYPRDLELVRALIEDLRTDCDEILNVLLEDESVKLEHDVAFVPIYEHRYLICTSRPADSIVGSIMGTDAIVYGATLRVYLEREFLD